jgi:signal peptidase II
VQEGRGTAVTGTGRARALLFLSALLTLAVDQATKALVLARLGPDDRIPVAGDVFGIVLRYNTGGAFGMGQGAPVFFFVATILIVVVATVWGWRTPALAGPVGLVVGGGLGTLVDRVRHGRVVDFLDLSFWPTFNVADSAIVVGVVLLLLLSARADRTRAGP